MQGSMWRIGSGKETRIWKDKWLPQPSSFMVQGQGQGVDEEAKVAELIHEDTKQCDREKILNMLGPANADVIQRIHVSSTGAVDKLMWLGTKDGSEETVAHILWNCSSAMDVWSNGPMVLQKSSVRVERFMEIFEWLHSQCELQTMELFAMTIWGIWQRRNKLVFESSFLHPNSLAQTAAHQLVNFKAAQMAPISATQMHTNHAATWTPPPEGVIKINWDAALREAHDRVGIGLVARDHEGGIVASKMVAKDGCVVPLLDEIVQGLNLHKERWDSVGLVLSDTRVLLARIEHWHIPFVKRSGNENAHYLAKKALELPEESSTMVIRPNCNVFPPMSLR
ncbi:hypothetical protein CIPAW_07G069100 [Carya illinoinensis]|uniref:RNase H type-1 domain-containing protein n=1 Tax=Carya illinoinensis TaxID=32201 RepID=A0A8T1PVT7_CARIL|nr:hypothetical protein CIPAW_07G069100 [Carya illinoinensis]